MVDVVDGPQEWSREADSLIRGHWNFDGVDSKRLLDLADDLEREHGETAKRVRLIVRAKEVYAATMGHETALAAVVDAVLAEVDKELSDD